MAEEVDVYQGKSLEELGWEAVWFVLHTLIALAVLLLIMFGGTALHADPDAIDPKLIGTAMALLLPLVAGFLIAKVRHDYVARYVWIAGLMLFAIVCVWVIDLPTGPGLCEHCGSLFERLRRTFFSIQDGSGLAGGWGLVLGCWVPLALIGYAVGAHLGIRREPEFVQD